VTHFGLYDPDDDQHLLNQLILLDQHAADENQENFNKSGKLVVLSWY